MSDRELRRLEQALSVTPDAAELHRQRAELLWRVGRDDAALSALDLAWRLGAPVADQLRERLAARRIELDGITLCYVPAGPFVMGRDDHDDDAPAHLVELSAFYMAQTQLSWETIRQSSEVPDWIDVDEENPWFFNRPVAGNYERAIGCCTYLTLERMPPGMSGAYRLPSEAQWERVFRAAYLTADRACLYGVEVKGPELEWTRDWYRADAYEQSPRRDPQGPEAGELRVVRGVKVLPAPYFASFREAAREDGQFPVQRLLAGTRWVENYPTSGQHVRPVFEPL